MCVKDQYTAEFKGTHNQWLFSANEQKKSSNKLKTEISPILHVYPIISYKYKHILVQKNKKNFNRTKIYNIITFCQKIIIYCAIELILEKLTKKCSFN